MVQFLSPDLSLSLSLEGLVTCCLESPNPARRTIAVLCLLRVAGCKPLQLGGAWSGGDPQGALRKPISVWARQGALEGTRVKALSLGSAPRVAAGPPTP